jgi:FtsH-binding integral membrane protein
LRLPAAPPGHTRRGRKSSGRVRAPLQGAGLIAALVAAVAGIAAIVVRLIRSRGIQRRQMWWFVVLITPVIAMIAIDTDGVIPGALSAVIVFTLILGAIGYPLLGRPASSPDLS